MSRGKVKWFNEKKGYGFISPESGSDVFVHYSSVKDKSSLNEGQSVEFDIENSPKGQQAKNVTIL